MALHAATVGILIEKSRFEPEVALGVAEAIELAMTQAQFVTVPILDARLHEVRTETRDLKSDLQRLSVEIDMKLDARFAQMEAKMEARFAAMEARFAQVDVKLAETEAKLVRWVFLVMLGNVALSLAANTVLSALKAL